MMMISIKIIYKDQMQLLFKKPDRNKEELLYVF